MNTFSHLLLERVSSFKENNIRIEVANVRWREKRIANANTYMYSNSQRNLHRVDVNKISIRLKNVAGVSAIITSQNLVTFPILPYFIN